MATARYWRNLGGTKIQCLLCPHACVLASGEQGFCGARKNLDGAMSLPFFGHISSMALDPIEKKPLRHFLPGSKTFSIGFWHCTMRCPFCQNWQIAHPVHTDGHYYSPEDVVGLALDSGSPSMSFTYSEPTLHLEYVTACMKLARSAHMKTVLVTNGMLLSEPAKEILELTDAVNVDLKTASVETYHQILHGELKVVQNFIQIAHVLCHVEVTSLLVPGILDTSREIESISRFLANISEDIPLHITSYHPAFEWNAPAMPEKVMRDISSPAYKFLKNVHVSEPIPY